MKEYKNNIGALKLAVKQHKETLVPGKPQLDWCDKAVMVSEFMDLQHLLFVG